MKRVDGWEERWLVIFYSRRLDAEERQRKFPSFTRLNSGFTLGVSATGETLFLLAVRLFPRMSLITRKTEVFPRYRE